MQRQTGPIGNEEERKRFIAFIDILGFRDLVLRSPDLSEFSGRYRRVFQPLEAEVENLGVQSVLFSDSLVIGVGRRQPYQELLSLLCFCQKLLVRTALERFPIRGAIAFGVVRWDGNVVVGRPIIEAVEYEAVQEWMGIVLAPSCTRRLLEEPTWRDRLETERLIRAYDKVPIKQKGASACASMKCPVVEYGGGNIEERTLVLEAIERMCLEAGSANATMKYLNTLEFLKGSPTTPNIGV